jgi:ATP-binding cassette subfamily B protein
MLTQKDAFKFYIRAFNHEKKGLLFILAKIPIQIFSWSIPILILLELIQQIQDGVDTKHAVILASYAIGATAISQGIARVLDIFFWKHIIDRTLWIYDYSYQKVMSKSVSFFSDNHIGSVAEKVGKLVSNFELFCMDLFYPFSNYIGFALTTFLVITIKAPMIGGFFVLSFFVFSIMIKFTIKNRIERAFETSRVNSELFGELIDDFNNVINVKVDSSVNQSLLRVAPIKDRYAKTAFRLGLSRVFLSGSINLIVAISLSIVLIPALLTEQPVEFIILIVSLVFPLLFRSWDITTVYQNVENYITKAREALILIEKDEYINEEVTKSLPPLDTSISFKNVKFFYPKGHEEVLSNFSLDISSGEKIGLVGPSGGGKSTLVKLILRFMDVDEGQILIGGQNLKDLSLKEIYSKIAYVPQDPVLFHKSVIDNIMHPNPNLSPKELDEILEKSHVKEFLDQLPQGLDTIVGERGVKLSGGQRQRIAIAKAMAKNAPILLLDEATSALDSQSEKLIQESFINLMENRTVVVIAHRLSTIANLDKIFVIKLGEVVESGDHKTLIKSSGLYKTLWDHQSSGFLGED